MDQHLPTIWKTNSKASQPIAGRYSKDDVVWASGSLMCLRGVFDMGQYRPHGNGYTYCSHGVAFSCRVGLLQPEQLVQMIKEDVHMKQSFLRAGALAVSTAVPSTALGC